VFVVISVHICMTLPVASLLRGLGARKAAITRTGAVIQIAAWICVYLTFIFVNEEEIQ
jgi:hypothetical protein